MKAPNRNCFTCRPGVVRLAAAVAPNTKNKLHGISADVVMADAGGEGVVMADVGRWRGSRFTSTVAGPSPGAIGSMTCTTW